MLVIVAPGQGAQTPGFLTPWLEDPAFAARFEWLSTVAGLDLVEHGTTSDAETIRATEVAQPLLVATGLVAALQLFPHPGDAFDRIEQLAALKADPPAKARLMPLSVAGAFHTHHMAPAVDHLASLARSVSVHDPRTRVISNRDGRVVHDGRDVLARIVGQIASPVRWDLCMETMADLGVTGVLEMPPAGTLTGILKRQLKGVETFALKSPDQLDEARAFCDRHGESAGMETTPTWRMVVSPAKGTFHLDAEAADRDVLSAGAPIGGVASLRDTVSVTAAHGGQVVEWLVEDGDLVSPGQPLLRLHPEGAA